MNSFHIPVLSAKIIENLHLKKAKTTIFDCTIGEGGITKEIINFGVKESQKFDPLIKINKQKVTNK